MAELYLNSEDVRYLLHNAGKIKRDGVCIECSGTGWTNWDEEGNDVKFGRRTSTDRDEGECEKCDGVGYTW